MAGLLAVLLALTLCVNPASRGENRKTDPGYKSVQVNESKNKDSEGTESKKGKKGDSTTKAPKTNKVSTARDTNSITKPSISQESADSVNKPAQSNQDDNRVTSSESSYPVAPLLLSIVALILAAGWWGLYIKQTLRARRETDSRTKHDEQIVSVETFRELQNEIASQFQKIEDKLRQLKKQQEASASAMPMGKIGKPEKAPSESVQRGYFIQPTGKERGKTYFPNPVYSSEERRVYYSAKIYDGKRAEFEPINNIDQIKSSDLIDSAVTLEGVSRMQAERMETKTKGEAIKEADDKWVITKKAVVVLA